MHAQTGTTMKNPLRVTFVIRRLKLGGAQRVVITLSREMMRQGHVVSVVCLDGGAGLEGAENLNVRYFPYRLRWLPPWPREVLLARHFDRWLETELGTQDLIFSNLSKANRILTRSRLKNVFVIVHNHLSQLVEKKSVIPFASSFRRNRLRRLYRRKPCVTVSRGVHCDFLNFLEAEADARFIPNPVNPRELQEWSLGYPAEEGDYIVHVGAFIPQKRHDLLLQAYKHSGVSERLLLVGQGPAEQQIRKLADQLGLASRVEFMGFRRNPYPIIAGAKLLVLSSDHEGLPVVLLEAVALGVPAVSTNCPSGPSEVLSPHCLAEAGSVSSLASLIKAAIEDPACFRSELPEALHHERVVGQYLALADC